MERLDDRRPLGFLRSTTIPIIGIVLVVGATSDSPFVVIVDTLCSLRLLLLLVVVLLRTVVPFRDVTSIRFPSGPIRTLRAANLIPGAGSSLILSCNRCCRDRIDFYPY